MTFGVNLALRTHFEIKTQMSPQVSSIYNEKEEENVSCCSRGLSIMCHHDTLIYCMIYFFLHMRDILQRAAIAAVVSKTLSSDVNVSVIKVTELGASLLTHKATLKIQ